jgi:hypothetical protein
MIVKSDSHFCIPLAPDTLWVPASKVDTETVTSHTYGISEKEYCCITEKL